MLSFCAFELCTFFPPLFENHHDVTILQVSNFLHLTPPAIKKHCEALKRMSFKNVSISLAAINIFVHNCIIVFDSHIVSLLCGNVLRMVSLRLSAAAFCTEWPAALDSDAKCKEHFPIQVQTKEYMSAGPSLRNPDSRIVNLTVSLG